MNMLKCCLNWKVIAGLGAVGLAIWVMAPGTVAAALPLLVALVCPLSMILMMGMIGRQGSGQQAEPVGQAAATGEYVCPMHLQVRASQPGQCPTCGMDLVPAASPREREALPAAAPEPVSREEQLAQLRAELQRINEQQAVLARQVGQLEGERSPAAGPNGQVVQQAEQVAQAADRKV